jgi:hypothetical protein
MRTVLYALAVSLMALAAVVVGWYLRLPAEIGPG